MGVTMQDGPPNSNFWLAVRVAKMVFDFFQKFSRRWFCVQPGCMYQLVLDLWPLEECVLYKLFYYCMWKTRRIYVVCVCVCVCVCVWVWMCGCAQCLSFAAFLCLSSLLSATDLLPFRPCSLTTFFVSASFSIELHLTSGCPLPELVACAYK